MVHDDGFGLGPEEAFLVHLVQHGLHSAPVRQSETVVAVCDALKIGCDVFGDEGLEESFDVGACAVGEGLRVFDGVGVVSVEDADGWGGDVG